MELKTKQVDHRLPNVALRALIGTRLTEMVRAMDMDIFRFSAAISAIPKEHRVDETRAYEQRFALHVQCPWRLSRLQVIKMGEGDRFVRATSLESPPIRENNDAEIPKLLEQRVFALRQLSPDGLMVIGVTVDPMAGIEILLEDEYVLTVFPSSSAIDEYCEHWRFICLESKAHLVASANGFEEFA